MVVVGSRSPAPGVVHCLLAAALLLASTATGVAAADSSTLCDTAKCGRGTCSEVPGIIPGTAAYNCTCDPGWSQPINNSLLFGWLPCMVPHCTFDSSCYNFSFLFKLPPGIPIGDPCVADLCGSGECKAGTGWMNYTCDCPTGTHNVLNQTRLPCMKDCSFGDDCSKVGLSPSAPPPQSSTTAPPPGSASSWRLLQQLLWPAVLLLLQIV